MAETPWVFRYRSALIGVAFLASWLAALTLGKIAPFPSLVGQLSLPANLLLERSDVARQPPYWPLVIPVALGFVGAALRFWGTSYLRGHIMADKEMHSERLIIAGPFRFVRNPLYLGNLFVAAAWGLYFRPPALVVSVLAMAVVVAIVARAEARGLHAQHGVAYDEYARKVHAFVPRLRPFPATATVKPDWFNGLTSEAWAVLMPLYFAAFALREPVVAWGIFAVLFAALLYRRSANRKARAAEPPPP